MSGSGTRPKRFLSTTPRRSDRLRDSPSIDYTPQGHRVRNSPVSQSRSRSKSRVIKDSHGTLGIIDENEAKNVNRRLELNQRGRLDYHSDNEDEDQASVGSLSLPHLEKVNTLDVIGTFGMIDNTNIFTKVQDKAARLISDSVSSLKSYTLPNKSEIIRWLKSKTFWFASFMVLLAVTILYLLSVYAISSSESDSTVLPKFVNNWLSSSREAFLSVPDYFQSKDEVSNTQVDYDTLVTKILKSQRFSVLVEDASLQHRASLEAKLQQSLQIEMDAMYQRTEELDARLQHTIRSEIESVKSSVSFNEEKIKQEAVKSTEHSSALNNLLAHLDLLEKKLETISQGQTIGEAGSQNDVEIRLLTDELKSLQKRLSALEMRIPDVQTQVKSCCDNKPDIKQELEDKLNEILANDSSSFIQTASLLFTTKSDLLHQHESIERELTDLRENMMGQVKAETDSMNAKLELLAGRARAVHEMKNNDEIKIADQTVAQQRVNESEYVERIVKQALAKYDADKTGLFDFALESAGGSIVSTRCTENYEGSSAVLSVMGVPIWWETNNPRSILQPGMAPGQCWAFRGSTGAVVVKLSSTVVVKAVSIEHISLKSTPDGQISSAPKSMTLAGVIGENQVPLANFTYEKSGDPVQTFSFQSDIKLNTVELSILSNHGHPDYTCLYRFRVHGDPAEEEKIH